MVIELELEMAETVVEIVGLAELWIRWVVIGLFGVDLCSITASCTVANYYNVVLSG